MEIIDLVNIILEQNYIQHKGQWYKQVNGLAVGAPTSAILTETVIQHLEHTVIINKLKKLQIIDYYRYVDDILIIINAQITNINDTINEFNMMHHKIKFTMEEEQNNNINYLDLTITKVGNSLQLGIYRKPTITDHIIHNESCHLFEHKKAAINYLVNQMNKYLLTHTNRNQEKAIINEILVNNNYSQQDTYQKQKLSKPKDKQKTKWATFTYYGLKTRVIIKLSCSIV
jgi:hypothetical protein